MLFYLIRHADPIYNPDSITDLGKRQAEALARRLAVHGIDEIYYSPMIRARQTAQPLSEILKKPVQIEPWTYECWEEFAITKADGNKMFCNNIEGTEFLSDENYPMIDNWFDIKNLETCTAKKGWDRITKEADIFFEKHGYLREGRIYRITEPNEKKIALFCHGGFGSILLSYLLNIPPHIFWSGFDLSHSGVCILRFKNFPSGVTAPKCLVHSDLSHIYGENLPMRYNNLEYI